MWQGHAKYSETLLWGWAGPAYRYHGCFDDRNGPFQGNDRRTLPQVHDNFRSGIGLDECAAAARAKGFPFFALQWQGLCFFGSAADVARLQASQRLSDDKCSALPCKVNDASCPGNINKIYFLVGAHTLCHLMVSRMPISRFCPGRSR
jgi:hypothetical protein